LVVTLFVQDLNSASIRQDPDECGDFWTEMECAQWFLLRALCEFYESSAALSETLAVLYMDGGFIGRYLSSGTAEVKAPDALALEFRICRDGQKMPPAKRTGEDGAEPAAESQAAGASLRAIHTGILQRPVGLNLDLKKETGKFIRATYPECRLDYKGFGSFLGYSDLNRYVFWSPFLLLRHFHLQYRRHGEEITVILSDLARMAGLSYVKREITADNPPVLARSAVAAVRKKFNPS
jgi:hypothetical protein